MSIKIPEPEHGTELSLINFVPRQQLPAHGYQAKWDFCFDRFDVQSLVLHKYTVLNSACFVKM